MFSPFRIVLVTIALTLLAAGCDDDSSANNDGPACGNGVVEEGEVCDGYGIQPVSCDELVPGSLGLVFCNLDCLGYDTSDCAVCSCGDGVACGVDAGGEQCDVDDFAGKTCSDYGDFTGGELSCTDACTVDTSACVGTCSVLGYMEECDPDQGVTACCPLNGLPADCTEYWSDGQGRCLQTCELDNQCGWHHYCENALGSHCYKALCGEGVGSTPVNSPCSLGTKSGYCLPTGRAMDDEGLCYQNGTAAHGESCESDPLSPVTGVADIDPSTQCANGLCMVESGQTTGTCVDFCDPLLAAAGTESCPAGWNCVGFSSLYESFPTADGYLYRSADKGYCQPMEDNVHPVLTHGITACNLLTGLTTRGGSPCPAGEGCKMLSSGTLIGECSALHTTTVALGESCALPADLSESYPCEAGAHCYVADPFNDPNQADPAYACSMLCDPDTYDSNPACAGLTDTNGAPYVCLTLSRFFTSDHELPDYMGEVESSPSPVGLCVPPPAL